MEAVVYSISLIIRWFLTLAIAIPLVIAAFLILPTDGPKLGEWLWWTSICLGISMGLLFVEAARLAKNRWFSPS